MRVRPRNATRVEKIFRSDPERVQRRWGRRPSRAVDDRLEMRYDTEPELRGRALMESYEEIHDQCVVQARGLRALSPAAGRVDGDVVASTMHDLGGSLVTFDFALGTQRLCDCGAGGTT